jgi:hypothetical protein
MRFALTLRNPVCERRAMRAAVALLLTSLLAVARTVAAQPSSDLDDYVLFAEEILKADSLLVPCGDVGVDSTSGLFRETNGITVAGNCVGNTARMDGLGSCGALYANLTVNPTQPPLTFTPPVLSGSIASNCGFPPAPFGCDLAQPVTVDAGDTVTLPAGVYGHVTVKGGFDEFLAPNPGVLRLSGGTYVFCNVKLARFGQIRALAATEMRVDGKLKMASGNFFGPDTGNAASDFTVFVNGTKVRYSRESQVTAKVCAPQANCGLLDGGSHFGGTWCRKLKARDLTVTCASPSPAFVD